MKLLFLIIMEVIEIYSQANIKKDKEIYLRNQDKIINYTNIINIFIMTHKDFYNILTNQIYKIVADSPNQLKKKYGLKVIYSNKGKIFNKSEGYGEMAKLYYIYELYKKGNLSSKYIGLNHYRRYFNFLDDAPDFDKIFENYDIILNNKSTLNISLETQYCALHICKSLQEVIKILKEIKPEYYKTAKESLKANEIYYCNLFIMKKEDFFKYCEFIYDILLEYDRRYNFTYQKDIINYVKTYFPEEEIPYQMRLEGFLAERLSTIFFKHNFKKIKIFPIISIDNILDINEEKKKFFYKTKIIFFLLIFKLIFLFIKFYSSREIIVQLVNFFYIKYKNF